MRQLLFSCGFASGGTDLAKNILNSHPDIYIASEMTRLVNIGARGYDFNAVFTNLGEVNKLQKMILALEGGHLFENIDYDFSQMIQEKGTISLEDVVRLCLSNRDKDTLVWGAKVDAEQIGALAKLFPKAKFLLVSRDVRDVCLSWRSKWGKDMVWCASKWTERMAKGLDYANVLGTATVLVVKFEDLLTDTERSCHAICDYLGISFSEQMLNYHKYTERWESKRNYGQPIKAENKEKWRLELDIKKIMRIEEIAYDTMTLLGYQPQFAAKLKQISLFEKYIGVCRDFWAMLFIGNRTLKDRNTMKLRIRTTFNAVRGLLLRSELKK